ncbi:MAG TPA: hypothetical protein VHZ30_01325 [Verrucomicrobiae bacterium]|nr:hypothetical protein [Verrucomicrobiae bacterium]
MGAPREFGGASGGIASPNYEAAQQRRPTRVVTDQSAFTLLEVMLAVTIFFMAMFAILGLLTSGVRAASMLRNNGPTAGMILAQLSATNILEEGSKSGNFKDVPIYNNYQWAANLHEVDTNGLFQVDVVVTDSKGNPFSTMSALLYRPDSEKNKKLGLQQQPGQR